MSWFLGISLLKSLQSPDSNTETAFYTGQLRPTPLWNRGWRGIVDIPPHTSYPSSIATGQPLATELVWGCAVSLRCILNFKKCQNIHLLALLHVEIYFVYWVKIQFNGATITFKITACGLYSCFSCVSQHHSRVSYKFFIKTNCQELCDLEAFH